VNLNCIHQYLNILKFIKFNEHQSNIYGLKFHCPTWLAFKPQIHFVDIIILIVCVDYIIGWDKGEANDFIFGVVHILAFIIKNCKLDKIIWLSIKFKGIFAPHWILICQVMCICLKCSVLDFDHAIGVHFMVMFNLSGDISWFWCK